MNVTTQELENCEVLMTVEIDEKQKTRLLEKAAKRISKDYRIPGFRPGKAPFRIVVNKFGIEAIQEEAMSELTEDVFRKALDEAKITPFDQASLDDIQWEPLTMKVKIPISPVVELGDYRDIRIDFDPPEVSDEDIAEELENLRNRHATSELVERPAEMGDQVKVNVIEKEADAEEALSEQNDLNLTLMEAEEEDEGPDLSANVVGLAAGESKTWSYTYPEDYSDTEFAGKTVEITADVQEVSKRDLPELDDDFAALIGDYDDLDQLKEALKENVRRSKQYEVDQELMPTVLDQVIDQATLVKWPPVLEEHEIDHAITHREQDLAQQGLDLQTFLQTQQKTEEEFRNELRESVQSNLKQTLILNKVIELENLKIDPDELRQQAEFMMMIYGGSPQARQTFQSPAGLQMLANNLLYDKARERLLSIAKGETIEDEAEMADVIEGEAETGVEAGADVEVAEAEVTENTDAVTAESEVGAEADTDAEVEVDTEVEVNEAANDSVNDEDDAADDSESSQKSE